MTLRGLWITSVDGCEQQLYPPRGRLRSGGEGPDQDKWRPGLVHAVAVPANAASVRLCAKLSRPLGPGERLEAGGTAAQPTSTTAADGGGAPGDELQFLVDGAGLQEQFVLLRLVLQEPPELPMAPVEAAVVRE